MVALHNVMDCLRDFILNVGLDFVEDVPNKKKLIKTAYGMCVDREYISLTKYSLLTPLLSPKNC